MAEKKINILMTGGGAPGAAGILQCLSEDGLCNVFMADANADALGSHLSCAGFETIPFGDDPGFCQTLLSICKKRKIDVILPLVTKELIPLASNIKLFEQAGIKIPISQAASLEIANNKSRLYEFLQWRDIAVPDFRVAETVDQFKKAVHELGYPENPVCFKPSVSNGSRGFRIIKEDINEADLLFNHKPNTVYTNLNDVIRILSTNDFPELLVSEYLPGDEFSVDCLTHHGKSILIIPRLRKKMINGISVEGEFIKNDEIIEYCSKIVTELKLHGNIGIQVKASSAGKFMILEINPRVQGSIVTCLGAGVNLPLLAIKQELGLSSNKAELQVKWGTKFSKYWKSIYY